MEGRLTTDVDGEALVGLSWYTSAGGLTALSFGRQSCLLRPVLLHGNLRASPAVISCSSHAAFLPLHPSSRWKSPKDKEPTTLPL